MDQATRTRFNARLAALAHNGTMEVGLEVGTDPGLAADEYIQIPACLQKAWAGRLEPSEVSRWDALPTADQHTGWAAVGANQEARNPTFTAAAQAARVGWVTCDEAVRHEGHVYARIGGRLWQLAEVVVDPVTVDDCVSFITVNLGHCRDSLFNDEELNRVLAIRFWAVITGLVVTNKNEEWVDVANPTTPAANADVRAAFVLGYAENALTAAAARATSWRKSNHCTGGTIASGFPRRWLVKEDLWSTNSDRQARNDARAQATTMFYVATHGISVHAVLANMAPSDDHHWVQFQPKYGHIAEWDVKESTTVRMHPRTQVAGAAQVADAIVALKTLVSTGYAGALQFLNQAQPLMAAFNLLEAQGMRCATYARWFFDGHPLAVVRESFNQRDPAFHDLVQEIAIAITLLYPTATISASMSLRNAASQSGNEAAKTLWSAIAATQHQAQQGVIMTALERIVGSSATGSLVNIASGDAAQVRQGVATYNQQMAGVATIIGMAVPPVVDEAAVLARAGLPTP